MELNLHGLVSVSHTVHKLDLGHPKVPRRLISSCLVSPISEGFLKLATPPTMRYMINTHMVICIDSGVTQYSQYHIFVGLDRERSIRGSKYW